MQQYSWFQEKLHLEIALHMQIDHVLVQEQTAFQDLLIFDNSRFGRVLALDGAIQTTQADEFIYHEMITHIPILAHGAAHEVLIIGGGDGGVLRRCVLHPQIERVTMIEIDATVIERSKHYLSSINANAFDHPKTDLIISDAAEYIVQTDRFFDVIIVDSTDPQGPSLPLFSSHFYEDCKKRLRANGLIVAQSGTPFLQPTIMQTNYHNFRTVFRDAWFYTVNVPSYIGGLLAIGWATDEVSLRQHSVETIRHRFEHTNIKADYYTPDIHIAAFALPQYCHHLMKI